MQKPNALGQFYRDCAWLPAYGLAWAALSWRAAIALFVIHWVWNIYRNKSTTQNQP